GFYHGGDLRGVIDHLDYIEGLGTTAIWLTPSFKNKPVQGTAGSESAGYHGYWITDFTQIDPHLGSNADMKELIDAAHARGMKVFFDIITNHTADVISYAENQYTYRDKAGFPYKDKDGTPFDDRDYVNQPFPPMDPATSFPYTPVFPTDADATAKTPSWLNDHTLYHNRGDSTFAGESSEYGDFVGLDDLFTERPEVVEGMGAIYEAWVDLGIDGFRIDTVKHVNMEFWQEFSPRILSHARDGGNEDFFMFGEVYDAKPEFMSRYTTTGQLPATLDFGFQQEAINLALGKPTVGMRDLWFGDDWYTDADSNAYQLPTFLGNHDMGRAAMFVRNGGFAGEELLQRTQLANSLMFLTRGQPVIYYGDEQGFMGQGGDKDARQDMFATQVAQYAGEPVLGGASGSVDRYDPEHPLYRQLASLADLRAEHPALADGAQVHRYASGEAGVLAFSRVDKASGREYVVALNNATAPKTVTFDTYSANRPFKGIHGAVGTVHSAKDRRLTLTVPPLTAVVYRALQPMQDVAGAPPVTLTTPDAGGIVGPRGEISASVGTSEFAQVTFWHRPIGTSQWQLLGTDDNAPYRVFHDTSDLPEGTLVEYRAVAKDLHGDFSADADYGVVGTPLPADVPGGEVGPVTQPSAVSVPGSHNSEMGCSEDWLPACSEAQLSLDTRDQVWKATFTLPVAEYAYKAALNNSWDENYGAKAVRNGDNISYTAPTGPVTFYYDHRTKYVTSSVQGPLYTAAGSFQSELGCGVDNDPACMRPWLTDPDGDGTYTWASTELPAGDYGFTVYENATTPKSGESSLAVPAAGMLVTISWTPSNGTVTAKAQQPAAVPDLSRTSAHFVTPDTIAYPRASVPAGTDPTTLKYKLHWTTAGTLVIDIEDVVGGESALLAADPAGFTAEQVAAQPELADHIALRLDSKTARTVAREGGGAAGQMAVSQSTRLGALIDATGVDKAWCTTCRR
ncbi:MAG: alpha-amylase family glycosyl hydrolase, partial [Actinomycetes bacterium]